MNRNDLEALINDYLDGILPAGERQRFERRLEGDETLRAEVARHRNVVKAIAELPREVELPEDIWPSIADRIDRDKVVSADFGLQPRRFRWRRWALPAVAAATLVVLSSTVTALVMQRRPAPSPVSGGYVQYTGPSAHPAAVAPFEAEYAASIAELEDALNRGRNTLAPETLQTIEGNLQIIDGAIREAREALVLDPASSPLRRHLVDAYQEKVDLLRRAARLMASS